MIVASTIVPCDTSSPLAFSRPLTASSRRIVRSCCSSKWAKVEDCCLVRKSHRDVRKTGKTTQALDVVEPVLHLSVRQGEPLLKKVDRQHRGQTDRRTTAPSGPRIVRFHHPQQLLPRNHRVHLGQNISRRVRRFWFA